MYVLVSEWKLNEINKRSAFLFNQKDFEIRGHDETTESINDGSDITGPYFDAHIPNNVTAIVGKSAFLRCKVRNLGNKTVSSLYFFVYKTHSNANPTHFSWHGFDIGTYIF